MDLFASDSSEDGQKEEEEEEGGLRINQDYATRWLKKISELGTFGIF